MLGFIPLPLSDEQVTITGVEVPTLGIYAATSSISVTLALALMTFVTHAHRRPALQRPGQLLQELDLDVPRRACTR